MFTSLREVQLAVKTLDECVLGWLSKGNIIPIDPSILNPLMDGHAGEFGAVVCCPAVVCVQAMRGRTIVLGIPRSGIIWFTSRVTRQPEKDVSAISTKFSRVKSSTTVNIRNLLPPLPDRWLPFAASYLTAMQHSDCGHSFFCQQAIGWIKESKKIGSPEDQKFLVLCSHCFVT